MQQSFSPNIQSLKPADRLQQLLPELFSSQPISGEQFLRLQLAPDLTVVLALSWIEETLRIPTQWITSMPSMSPHMLGLMSSKGQVFWVAHLTQLLQLPVSQMPSQYYEVVVIRALPHEPVQDLSGHITHTSDALFWGLVVPKIRGVIRLSKEDIISPETEVLPGFQPYLSGQATVDNQSVLVLSTEAIGRSLVLASD